MTDCSLSEVWFPRTHDQKSLTLHWRSFSWWGMEGIVICFAYKGCQKRLYDWLQHIGGVIPQHAWPQIVEALLTLIWMMAQRGYCNLCCQYRQPKIPLSVTTTYLRCDFTARRTNNRWRSADPHFAMAVSTLCNHWIWHSLSFTLFWLSFMRFHLHSFW